MLYGYMRPIVQDQQCAYQLIDLDLDGCYTESHGLAKNRTTLEELLMNMQQGDELVIQNIVVLIDSIQQLVDILRLAQRDRFTIHFLDEQLTNHTVHNFTLLEMTSFFAKLQSLLLSHSSTFSLQAAKEQGKSIGRPRKSDTNLQHAFAMYDSKEFSLFEIKEATGISKSTLYRYLDNRS